MLINNFAIAIFNVYSEDSIFYYILKGVIIMSSIKKFIGEQAYKYIENSAYNADAIRKALITPQNARAVFSDLTEYQARSLVAEISNSGMIGKVRPTTQEEIKAAFAEAGYTTVIFDDKEAIAECVKYYRPNERICTYNSLDNRMKEYHMLVAIKGNIDEIKPSNYPERDDEYGTSIINVQIARNGSHMSIKNRYNHTVSQCDSTFDNDLNHITMGLQSMVLGYYGFAGLTNENRSHYNNIVNIGGVYLKYHTEKNNIYFGAFVLDGTNGARYTDTSRYYITNGGEDSYYRSPMVLDFHGKTAIDLTGENCKIPLVSRAMREGLLNSGNKEQAETINAVFPNAKKELLQANRKALKYAAEVYGYDFQKPYNVIGILGKFTANSIEKITGSTNALLLLSNNGKMKIVELNSGRFNANEVKKGWYKYNIGTFFRQGDFEETRKSGNAATYIIQQDKQYRRVIKEKQGRTCIYINGRSRYFDEMSETEIAQYELSKRLDLFKANKRKAEAQAIDYTATITTIEKEFATLKTEIITRLVNAEKYEDYDTITDVTNYELCWLVRDISDIKALANTKGFSSPQQAQKSIEKVRATISKMWGKLNK
jgi:DNA-directed RNA polymerase subunit F